MNKEQEKKQKWEPTCEMLDRLAKNPPKWEGETIFVLHITTVGCRCEDMRRSLVQHYASDRFHGMFRTVEEAEREMRKNKKGAMYGEKIFCQKLLEYPYGKIESDSEYVSWRAYDRYGNLVMQSVCAHTFGDDEEYKIPYGVFYGRPDDMQPFKPGDLVEYLWQDEIHLAVVADTPFSTQKMLERYKRVLEERKRRPTKRFADEKEREEYLEWIETSDALVSGLLIQDYSDDTYYLLDGPDCATHDWHIHVEAENVFVPHGKVSEKVRERYQKFYERWRIQRKHEMDYDSGW